jgi:hypothetical protein
MKGLNESVSPTETGDIDHETVTNGGLGYASAGFIYRVGFRQFNVVNAASEPRSGENLRVSSQV